MKILPTPLEVQQQCRAWRQAGHSLALVPTMGFFHQGHESLMRLARERADKVVVSLFVNPSQFAPTEDLSSYPRDFERDSAIARSLGVDLLFTPTPAEMYPPNFDTWVQVPGLSRLLCGSTRPTHFQGVCTVVLKLFNIIQPDLAIFGQKDWQQLAIIRRMAQDLHLTLRIEGAPLVREADGLAMSSRNSYLTQDERAVAPHIYQGLCRAADLFAQGERNPKILEQAVLEYWRLKLPQGRVDYLQLVDPATLQPETEAKAASRLITAVYLGKARLLDNRALKEK